jgi:hypothetical protein
MCRSKTLLALPVAANKAPVPPRVDKRGKQFASAGNEVYEDTAVLSYDIGQTIGATLSDGHQEPVGQVTQLFAVKAE